MDQLTKVCARCCMEKAWADFYIDRRRGRPLAYCKPCKAEYRRANYTPRPRFAESRCKQCDKDLLGARTARALFCGKGCRSSWHNAQQSRNYRRDSWMRSRYGISLDEYNDLLASQGGKCGICGIADTEAPRGLLYVDHGHATGRVRGLLCHTCNLALGMLSDDPAVFRRAAEYLEAAASH